MCRTRIAMTATSSCRARPPTTPAPASSSRETSTPTATASRSRRSPGPEHRAFVAAAMSTRRRSPPILRPSSVTLRHPSRRDLRLASGLVLFAYVTLHFVNHSLGLVSIAVAERGLAWTLALWHSVPGTVILYGAVCIHLALAF